jgi:hypothetical protein
MNERRGAHRIAGGEAIGWGLVVHLRDEARPIVVPWTFTGRLAQATSRAEREAFRVIGTHHVRWDALDEDLHVDDLYEWAKAQEGGSLPFFAAGVPKTQGRTIDLHAYRSIGPSSPGGGQSSSLAETAEEPAGAEDIYQDPQSWDVLRDILDELRSDDPDGVAAFELALARQGRHRESQADALRDALVHEKAERLTLENAGRLTEALARATGLKSAATLLAQVVATARHEEPPQGHERSRTPEVDRGRGEAT